MTERPISGQPIPAHAKKVFTGVLFDVYQWEQEMFDGSIATFEKLKRQDTVVVMPVLPDNRFLIVEDEQPGRATVTTFPGGRIDGDESPEDAAKRELLEETGYAPKELILYKAIQPVSKLDWVLYFFVARGCEKVAEPHLDAGERIAVRTVTFEEVSELMDTRFQSDGIAIDFLKARYDAEEKKKLEKILFGA